MRTGRRTLVSVEELTTVTLVQLYRGELGRSDRWRTRLDTTSNWALTVTAAASSFSFGSAAASHVTLLVGMWLVATFLVLEARRYRYYDLWNRRVRLLENGVWAPLLRHEPLDEDALRELAAELSRPQLQLSFVSALATRMGRLYGSLLGLLVGTWAVKLYSHPFPSGSLETFLQRAHVGPVPGVAILASVGLFTLGFGALFVLARLGRGPLGELRPGARQERLALGESLLRPYPLKPPRKPRAQG